MTGTSPLSPDPDRTAAVSAGGHSGPPLDGELPSLAGYRVLGKLGEGGMGTVYLAEQQSPRRRVALKVIRGGSFVDDARVRMFRREVETLARLKHPGIAAIHESGRTEGGQPFFAMELVEGVTLDAFLRRRAGSALEAGEVRYRLRLFRRIVDAVHYAHQRGVIHRDLKPSNILVDEGSAGAGGSSSGEGDVKILDFGLARLVDPDAQATALSEIGTVRGTLPYMSPEQARGEPEALDVRTDVYSLGVVLYEMLSGDRPYDVGGGSLLEAIRVISEVRPAPLRADATRRRSIDPDVETICLKALEKDPDLRYASAAALSDDVERYLASQPILARPPSTLYQLRKLVARNRTPAALAATLFLVAVGSAVSMGILWQGQRAERERAVAEAERTGRVNTFLQGMLESVSPDEARGEEVTVRYLLDGAATRAEEELGDDPDLRAEVQQTLGRTYRAIAAYDRADTLLHASLRARRELFGEESVEVSATLQDLARLAWQAGQPDTAEAIYRRALDIDRALGEEERIPLSLNNLGSILLAQGRNAEAEPVLRESVELHRKWFGDDNAATSKALANLAQSLSGQRKFAEAEPLLREALAMTIRNRGEDHPLVATTRANLAILLYADGRADEAVPMMHQVVEADRRVYGDHHPEVGKALDALGWALLAGHRWEESVDAFRESLEIGRESLGNAHPQVVKAMAGLALGLRKSGRPAEARPLYVEALSILRQADALQRGPLGAYVLIGLGRCLFDLEELPAAERILTEALDVAAARTDAQWIGTAHTERGRVRLALGRPAEAEADLLEGWKILGSGGVDDEAAREAAGLLADLYEARGEAAEAATWRSRSNPAVEADAAD